MIKHTVTQSVSIELSVDEIKNLLKDQILLGQGWDLYSADTVGSPMDTTLRLVFKNTV